MARRAWEGAEAKFQMLPTVAQILLYKTLPRGKATALLGPAKSHNKVRLSGGRGCRGREQERPQAREREGKASPPPTV